MLISQKSTSWLAYLLFALTGISFSYSCYTFFLFIPNFKKNLLEFLRQHWFSKTLMENYRFRTIVFSVLSFIIHIGYAIFGGVLAILSSSIWFGALSIYYLLLSFMRFYILYQQYKLDPLSQEYDKLKIKAYQRCGIHLLVLDCILGIAIIQMIFSQKGFQYAGIMIYAAAAYTFYKVTMSILHLKKARKLQDPLIQSLRNINLTNALVSLLGLQTALLTEFGSETTPTLISIFNAVTGTTVILLAISLGLYMIHKANQQLKELKNSE